MITTIKPSTYLFGIVNPKPAILPPHWKYVGGNSEWLTAWAPDGKIYYVHSHGLQLQGTATQEDVIRTKGRLTLGQKFAASDEIIPFPICP